MSTHLWHPFADMAVVKNDEVVIARGQGAVVWDENGREYIDARAGLWYCSMGHGRAELAGAAAARCASWPPTRPSSRSPTAWPRRWRADGVIAPMDGAKVFFTPGGGSDAIDTAAKLARAYWHAVGQDGSRSSSTGRTLTTG